MGIVGRPVTVLADALVPQEQQQRTADFTPMQFTMESLLVAILDDDRPRVDIKSEAALAIGLIDEARLYEEKIFHWVYGGDSALHLAAAGYRVEIVQRLLDAGADPNAARNHRRSGPLHYAADGYINGLTWDARRQVQTIELLLKAGARINVQDKNGTAPLHRAVRTRCADAVDCLLTAGADPQLRNTSGSTPFHLAVQNTGRGGGGAEEAMAAQRKIITNFLSRGLSVELKDGHGKSVQDCARSGWIQCMLAGDREKPRDTSNRDDT